MMFLTRHEGNKFIVFVFLFIGLILIDQGTKLLAKNIFINENFAFSLPLPVWLMYPFYFVVIAWLFYNLKKNFYELRITSRWALVLILAGAVSNFAERLIFGHVKDFIYIKFLGLVGIYNLADFYILLGIILVLCYGLTTNQKKLE